MLVGFFGALVVSDSPLKLSRRRWLKWEGPRLMDDLSTASSVVSEHYGGPGWLQDHTQPVTSRPPPRSLAWH
ncbi:unnamed protein product [Caenorhabditis brenneri]